MEQQNSRPYRVAHNTNTFSSLDLSQHRHCWKNDEETGQLDPIWPREPDVETARKLAIAHLPAEQFAEAKLEPFSQGAFHRLYSITSSNDPASAQVLDACCVTRRPIFQDRK